MLQILCHISARVQQQQQQVWAAAAARHGHQVQAPSRARLPVRQRFAGLTKLPSFCGISLAPRHAWPERRLRILPLSQIKHQERYRHVHRNHELCRSIMMGYHWRPTCRGARRALITASFCLNLPGSASVSEPPLPTMSSCWTDPSATRN